MLSSPAARVEFVLDGRVDNGVVFCWLVVLLTLQSLVELADRHDDSLDVFAVVEVLFGLFVAFFQVDFHGDHLCKVSFVMCFGVGGEGRMEVRGINQGRCIIPACWRSSIPDR
jgi:hypothetical protein